MYDMTEQEHIATVSRTTSSRVRTGSEGIHRQATITGLVRGGGDQGGSVSSSCLLECFNFLSTSMSYCENTASMAVTAAGVKRVKGGLVALKQHRGAASRGKHSVPCQWPGETCHSVSAGVRTPYRSGALGAVLRGAVLAARHCTGAES